MSSLIEKVTDKATKDDDLFCPTLSYKQRLLGFIVTIVVGYILGILSYLTFFMYDNFDAVQFVLLYSLGNVCLIMGSCFLWGPKRQCKNMMKPTRMAISIVLVLLIAATIVCAFIFSDKWWLILALGAAQLLAMFWYNMSYIPFARTLIKKCVKKCCCDCCDDEGDGGAPVLSS